MADRSPNYPSVGLSRAVEAAGKLWVKAKRSPVDNDTAAKCIGFQSLSGPARVLIAAMRQYGLIERTEDKHFKLTDLAVHALHGTVAERAKALKDAAVTPSLFTELMNERPDADDDVLRAYLVTKKRFGDDGARNAVKSFRDALDFAKLDASGYTGPNDVDTPKNGGGSAKSAIKVGDHVQWESQGVDQFITPPRVTHFSDDGTFVFVEGTMTGMPIEQIRKVEAPSIPPSAITHPVKPVAGIAREVSAFEEGEAVLQWPAAMSAESILELEDWLSLVVKKMKRRYGVEAK